MTKNYISLILFFLSFVLVNAQNQKKIDSLNLILKTSKIDSVLFRTHIDIGSQYRMDNPEISLKEAQTSIKLAKKLNDSKKIATSLRLHSTAYMYLSKLDSAVYYSNLAIELAKKTKNYESLCLSYTTLGNIAGIKHQNKESLKYYLKCLEISKFRKDSLAIAKDYDNIGGSYNAMLDYPNTLNYKLKSLGIREKIGHKESLYLSYINLQTVYRLLKQYDNSIKMGEKALKFSAILQKKGYYIKALRGQANLYFDLSDAEASKIGLKSGEQQTKAFEFLEKAVVVAKEYGNKSELSSVYNDLAYSYLTIGDNKKALFYYNLCLKTDLEQNDDYSICADKTALGEVNLNLGNIKIAENFCKDALQMAKKGNYLDYIQENHRLLNLIYEKSGNDKLAFFHFKKYDFIKDSLNNDDTKKAILNEQVKYVYEKKSIKDSISNANQKIIASAKLSKEKNQKLAFGSFALLALAGVGFTYFLYRQKRKTNYQLTEINDKINRQNNTLKTLNTELIVSEEKLQNSNNSKEQLISMMSHDLLNPITAITNYNQQIISRKNNSDELLEAFKTVDAAIQPMHGLLDNMLHWTSIQKDGINSKLKNQDVNDIIKEIIGIYRPQAQLKFIKLLDNLDTNFIQETDKSILSLILRNLINNAIKYSGNETEIEISSNSNSKIITIKDQGFGMTDEMIKYLNTRQLDKIESRGTGLGLKLCYEFAEVIGAAIVFEKNEVGITVKINL